MAADEAQNEPTMEEILASIRKIISEDDEPEQDSAVEESAGDDVLELDMEAEMEPEPMMAEEPEPEPEPEIEFEEPVMEEPEPDFEDVDIVAVEEPEPMPEPAPAPRFTAPPADDGDALLEDEVAGKAAGALGQLMGSMAIGNGATLESIVRELLRPMLKEWLNENLPGIVEAKVEEEVKRISRMAR
ncbi:MAG: hypothetical protein CMK03_01585 [Ponticaulis sp.]|nr:hypothetical protein [Ponticaulis sp.]